MLTRYLDEIREIYSFIEELKDDPFTEDVSVEKDYGFTYRDGICFSGNIYTINQLPQNNTYTLNYRNYYWYPKDGFRLSLEKSIVDRDIQVSFSPN